MNDERNDNEALYGRVFISWGSLLAFLAVSAGAFGAHGLKDHLSKDLLEIYQTGVFYHMIHALGMIAIGFVLQFRPYARAIRRAGWFMLAGITIFSGSLYLLSLTDIRWLGAITPIGGICLLVAWALLGIGTWKR